MLVWWFLLTLLKGEAEMAKNDIWSKLTQYAIMGVVAGITITIARHYTQKAINQHEQNEMGRLQYGY